MTSSGARSRGTTELVVAGWTLTVPAARQSFMDRSLPATFRTIGDCLQDLPDVPAPWWGNWYLDAPSAQAAAAAAGRDDVTVTTVAMHPDDARELLEDPEEPTEWFQLLRQQIPLQPDAFVAGYEVVGHQGSACFHSLLCYNGIADDAKRQLGISVNGEGLFDSYADALCVLEWMLDPPGVPLTAAWTIVALASEPSGRSEPGVTKPPR